MRKYFLFVEKYFLHVINDLPEMLFSAVWLLFNIITDKEKEFCTLIFFPKFIKNLKT